MTTSRSQRALIALLALGLVGLLGGCVEDSPECAPDSPTCSLKWSGDKLQLPDVPMPDMGGILPDLPINVPANPELNAPIGHLTEHVTIELKNDTSEFEVTGFWFDRLCGNALLKAELDAQYEASRHCHDEVSFYSWAELESRDSVRYENLGDFCYGEVTSTYTCHTADLSN